MDCGPGIIRYPDVVVDVAGGEFNDLTATAPALIAEVLSPSSAKDDLGAKAGEYLALPSLVAYLVLAQDEARVRVWVRDAGEFSSEPRVVLGNNAVIEIAPLGIDLPLAEIYGGREHP